MNAKTTMPRISNSTPVLLMIATSRDAEDVQHRDQAQRHDRDDPLVGQVVRMSQPMLLKAGISASGSVTHTEVIVMIPAKR